LPDVCIRDGLAKDGLAHFKLVQKGERLHPHHDEPNQHVVIIAPLLRIDKVRLFVSMLIVSCAKVWLERKSDRFEDEPTAFQILVDVEEFAAVGELYLLLQVL
jgi:hypothetical protein